MITDELWDRCQEFGLFDDCPLFAGLYDYVKVSAGATLTAVKAIKSGASVAINWSGGRHHAAREQASGFCYVNDVVLAIFALLEDKKFPRVLYIDLDAHHGDAVEGAFIQSEDVFTLSFHHFAKTFFPGTGSIDSTGKGRGAYRSLNIPFKKGISDAAFLSIVSAVSRCVARLFAPSCIVVQCGADGLAGDPTQSGNLTSKGFAAAFAAIMQLGLPTLVLGGGGYHPANVARCWTNLTGLCAGVKLYDNIPDHDLMMSYSPYFKLHTEALSTQRDENLQGGYMQRLVAAVKVFQRRYILAQNPSAAASPSSPRTSAPLTVHNSMSKNKHPDKPHNAAATARPLSDFLEAASASPASGDSNSLSKENKENIRSFNCPNSNKRRKRRDSESSVSASLSPSAFHSRSSSCGDSVSSSSTPASSPRSRPLCNIRSNLFESESSSHSCNSRQIRPSSAPPSPSRPLSSPRQPSAHFLHKKVQQAHSRRPRVLLPRPRKHHSSKDKPPEYLMPPPMFLPKRFHKDGKPVFAWRKRPDGDKPRISDVAS